MSTVKIKAEPATAVTATAAAVDVQVKLEPSLSIDDIKVEFDSDTDSEEYEEGEIKSEDYEVDDDDYDDEIIGDEEEEEEEEDYDVDDDADYDEVTTDTPNNLQRFICKHLGCSQRFHTSTLLSRHHHEHKLQTELSIVGKTYILTRQSLNDRWPCPIPGCEMMSTTADAVYKHVRTCHDITMKQQQPPTMKTRNNVYFFSVDDFYVNGVRCGYYNVIEVFFCHGCRLVPECLLTHLQQKHGYNEKSIDSSALPENAVNTNADPNIDQHTSNPHLAAAIGRPYQHHHPDIVQGWICASSDCGYCYSIKASIDNHHYVEHRGEQQSTVPALVLRLFYTKRRSLCFLITLLGTATGNNVTTSSNMMRQSELDSSHNGFDTQDDNGNTEQNQATDTLSNQQQWICEYSGCGRIFNMAVYLKVHQHEHKLQTELNVLGKTYTLARQSLDDRWTCPVRNCRLTYKTADGVYKHVRRFHDNTMGQQQCYQQPPGQIIQRKRYFVDMDNFYVIGVRCGYYNAIGVFVCHDCKLVPECLLTHLQQKHGYDEKSIDNSALPDSAVNASADPSINQHTNNPHLAAAISQPNQLQQHKDIVQGWLCVVSDCGHCGYTDQNMFGHKYRIHQGEQITTVPALILRLLCTASRAGCFFISRINQASDDVTTSGKRMNQHKLDYSHNGSNTHDEDEEDTDQNEITDEYNRMRQWKCEYPNCGCSYNSSGQLSAHRREHELEVVITVLGTIFNLSRQSLDDLWVCPVPECERTHTTVNATRNHIRSVHSTLLTQKRANSEDDDNSDQQQHQIIKRKPYAFQFFNVDDFYVNGVRCGYHNTIGVFICHECRLVPECLLTHVQQKHGYDEKSIDNAILPDSAITAGADPHINQQLDNSHLALAISQPHQQQQQQQHPDIVQGWLCVTSDCGYCSNSTKKKYDHKSMHQGEQFSTVLALVLRLHYAKVHASCFLITCIDQSSGAVTNSSNTVNQHDGLNARDENGDEIDQDEIETADVINKKKQWKCEYENCECFFNSSDQLCKHRREHKIEVVITVRSETYTLSRQSLNDRWSCPVPDCDKTCNTVAAIYYHIHSVHSGSIKQTGADSDDEDNDQQQQPIAKRRQLASQQLRVDKFYIHETRCGYHTTIGVFICYVCRLVPECLLTHLQQKHGYNEISIDNVILPESAVNANADPNINQHTSNPYLASVISQPDQQQDPDFIQGWVCITSDCGHCGNTAQNKTNHKRFIHQGENITTVPALILRVFYTESRYLCFFITRTDQASSAVNSIAEPNNSTSLEINECDDEEDIEVELSDFSDEDDVHALLTATVSIESHSTQQHSHPQPQLSQYNIFNMPLPDDPDFWRLVNNS